MADCGSDVIFELIGIIWALDTRATGPDRPLELNRDCIILYSSRVKNRRNCLISADYGPLPAPAAVLWLWRRRREAVLCKAYAPVRAPVALRFRSASRVQIATLLSRATYTVRREVVQYVERDETVYVLRRLLTETG